MAAKKEQVLFTHMQDPENKYDLGKSKRSCRHCSGTGVVGTMHLTGVRLVCACVMKAMYEDAEVLKKQEVAAQI